MNAFVIDKDKLASNIETVKSMANGRKLYAVVKGDGYGFGLKAYVRVLLDCGIKAFAVTEPHEAAAIRACGAENEEILMLRSTAVEDEVRSLISSRAVITVGSSKSAAVANGVAGSLGLKEYPVHIKIDTGMGRYGFAPDELDDITACFKYMENLEVQGLYTHLCCAFGSKKKTQLQVEKFLELESRLREMGLDTGCVHFANSSALFRFNHWDLKDAVRVGSALTGRLAVSAKKSGLERVGYLESRICELRWLKPGATVGYGCAYKAKRAVKCAIIPLGYSHGFAVEKLRDTYRITDCLRYILQDIKRTVLRERVWVKVNGKSARALGHIGMLHTVIDVTDIPCEIGDKVEVSANPLYVDARVPRKFIGQ